MKTCRKCGVFKRAAEYYKHAQMKDGRLNICIECVKTRVRKHRQENDSVREYDRKRYRENLSRRIKAAKNAQKWNERYPDRYRAHNMLSAAIRDGRLERGKKCELCGSKKNLEGHHDDYKKPLDVRWMCVRCHRLHHLGKST